MTNQKTTKSNLITFSNCVVIQTTWKGPTGSRGSRVIAKASNGFKVTVPVDYSLNRENMHAKAATALIEKMEWQGQWVAADNEKGFVFVCLDRA